MFKSSADRLYKSGSFRNLGEYVFSNQIDWEQNIWNEAGCGDKFPEFSSELKAIYDENLDKDDIFVLKEDNLTPDFAINDDFTELEQYNSWVAAIVPLNSFIEEQKENSTAPLTSPLVGQDSKTENKNINNDNDESSLDEQQNKEMQKNITSLESLKKLVGIKKEINPNMKNRFGKNEDRGRFLKFHQFFLHAFIKISFGNFDSYFNILSWVE